MTPREFAILLAVTGALAAAYIALGLAARDDPDAIASPPAPIHAEYGERPGPED
jgi:hypothetical protein